MSYQRIFSIIGAVTFCFTSSGWAEIVIEGAVKLPPIKAASAVASRYQLKAGVVAAPEPPAAVVYLEEAFPAPKRSSSSPQKMTQKDYQFVPGILPVRRGSKVEFPNHDVDYHHVFSYSKTKEFDLGRYRKDEKPAVVDFDNPGVVKVGCEIHDHMLGVILVLDTPYFTKTVAAGKYRLVLKDVPAGKYVLKAWVNEKTVWERPVELREKATLTVDFLDK